MADNDDWAGFLGTWILDPTSCRYEQGDPPHSSTYRIAEAEGGRLVFEINWVDAEGREHEVSFSGKPDGSLERFDGGDLADALSVQSISARDLRSSAYFNGVERMVAQRQLDATGRAMRVTQLVRLPTGESLANVGVYVKTAQA